MASGSVEDRMDLAELGAFVDTQGSTTKRRKRGKRLSETSDDAASLQEGRDEVEEKLESLVFGNQPFLKSQLESSSAEEDSDDEGEERVQKQAQDDQAVTGQDAPPTSRRVPVWYDEDDEEISIDISSRPRIKKLRKREDETAVSGTTYQKRLRTQFEKLHGQPEWAISANERKRKKRKRRATRRDSESESEVDKTASDSDQEEEEGVDILKRTGNLLAQSSENLPKGTIDLKRMKDANSVKRAQAVVRSVEFHPTANVLLTAGYHKTVDLFQIDGQVNPKLQSVHIQRFPITTAHFTRDGEEVVMAGQRKNFFVYNMVAGKITQIHGIRGREEKYFDKFVVSPDNQLLVFLGKDGYMPLVSNKTKQWVGDLKMNGTVRDVGFTPDGRHLLSTGSDGKVYVWDMSTRDCVHCFTDEGCLLGTKLSVSPSGSYVACGSDSGVVNVYGRDQCLAVDGEPPPSLSSNPKPLKSIMNLTTTIDQVCFNSTSEILAIASQRKKDALKLVHVPSLTVFSNWPTRGTPLGYVTALDISPHSHYVAIGNDKGKVLLYRLNHYYRGM